MNLYARLGALRGDSEAQLRLSFRKKALVTHPDKGGSADAFRAVMDAFETLSSSKRRAKYDKKLMEAGSDDGLHEENGLGQDDGLPAQSTIDGRRLARRLPKKRHKRAPAAEGAADVPAASADSEELDAGCGLAGELLSSSGDKGAGQHLQLGAGACAIAIVLQVITIITIIITVIIIIIIIISVISIFTLISCFFINKNQQDQIPKAMTANIPHFLWSWTNAALLLSMCESMLVHEVTPKRNYNGDYRRMLVGEFPGQKRQDRQSAKKPRLKRLPGPGDAKWRRNKNNIRGVYCMSKGGYGATVFIFQLVLMSPVVVV
ncbi:DnaJ-like subfamily B member 9 [Symbiodinium microadriaticum]|uniref:DnaJ-like subfamily B member 9 n=1 Tax=Symbiodinium microadriaticum TaxID=2951 RepID=A0A1Q9D8V8_SYMMI|nr:DnaJ-like subfamily B member 9 [Symbiodinium microadriaticum]